MRAWVVFLVAVAAVCSCRSPGIQNGDLQSIHDSLAPLSRGLSAKSSADMAAISDPPAKDFYLRIRNLSRTIPPKDLVILGANAMEGTDREKVFFFIVVREAPQATKSSAVLWNLIRAGASDRDANVRSVALEAATTVRSNWFELVKSHLTDSSDVVRSRCIYFLAESEKEPDFDFYKSYLNDNSPIVQVAAIYAVAKSGDRRAKEAISSLRNSDNSRVRNSVEDALSTMATD